MNIESLRKLYPLWTWTPQRSGFGWDYHGKRGRDAAIVRPFSRLVGGCDDVSHTEWRVSLNGAPFEPLWALIPLSDDQED